MRRRSRQQLHRLLSLASAAATLVMCYYTTLAVSGCDEFPLVVSRSAFDPYAAERGDLLLLSCIDPTRRADRLSLRVGEIIAFHFPPREMSLIHRVVEVHHLPATNVSDPLALPQLEILTKGDDNPVDDRGLYPPGENWVKTDLIWGRVVGWIPMCGRPAFMWIEAVYYNSLLLNLLWLVAGVHSWRYVRG